MGSEGPGLLFLRESLGGPGLPSGEKMGLRSYSSFPSTRIRGTRFPPSLAQTFSGLGHRSQTPHHGVDRVQTLVPPLRPPIARKTHKNFQIAALRSTPTSSGLWRLTAGAWSVAGRGLGRSGSRARSRAESSAPRSAPCAARARRTLGGRGPAPSLRRRRGWEAAAGGGPAGV